MFIFLYQNSSIWSAFQENVPWHGTIAILAVFKKCRPTVGEIFHFTDLLSCLCIDSQLTLLRLEEEAFVEFLPVSTGFNRYDSIRASSTFERIFATTAKFLIPNTPFPLLASVYPNTLWLCS